MKAFAENAVYSAIRVTGSNNLSNDRSICPGK